MVHRMGSAMAINQTHYGFRDEASRLWHFTRHTDQQGVHYELRDVDQQLCATALNMSMPFHEWVLGLIRGMMTL